MAVETHDTFAQKVFPRSGDRYFPIAEKTTDGAIVGHSVQTIAGSAQALYEVWHDLSYIPRWQENVVSVTPISDRVSHWVMGNPEDADGKRIEFDSQITEDIPGKLIAWTSITGRCRSQRISHFSGIGQRTRDEGDSGPKHQGSWRKSRKRGGRNCET